MKTNLLFFTLLSVLFSCTKSIETKNSEILETKSTITVDIQDSIFMSYVYLNGIQYELRLTMEEASALGVSEDKYTELSERMTGLNNHIMERKQAGDSILCLPPPSQEIEESIVVATRANEYPEDEFRYIGPWYGNGYIYFDALKTICAYISTSMFFSSVTVTFNIHTTVSYTVTSAQTTPNTSVHMTNPDPPRYTIAPDYPYHPDNFPTHIWELNARYESFGGHVPIIHFFKR